MYLFIKEIYFLKGIFYICFLNYRVIIRLNIFLLLYIFFYDMFIRDYIYLLKIFGEIEIEIIDIFCNN